LNLFLNIIFIAILSHNSFGQYVQEDLVIKKNDSIYENAQIKPQLIGGDDKFKKLYSKIKYPLYAKQNRVYGTVHLQITIDTSGHIINSKVLKSLGYGCDKEALRIIQLTDGKWSSASHYGKKVNAQLTIPIKFIAKHDGLNESAKARFKTGVKQFQKGNYKGALSFFNSALQLSPNYIDALHYRGECFFILKQPEKACENWLKSYELGKSDDQKIAKTQYCKNNLDSAVIIKTDTNTRILKAIDSTLFTKDFIFKDGIYLTYEEFQFNSPSITYSRIIDETENVYNNTFKGGNQIKSDFSKKDYFSQREKVITYYKQNGTKGKIKRKDVWGYCKNGSVYILSSNFDKLEIIGGIIQFIETNNFSYSPSSSEQTNVKAHPTEGYANQPPPAGNNSSFSQKVKIIDFETGKVYTNNLQNLTTLLKKDEALHKEFLSLQNDRKRKQMMFIFLKRFNNRNPIYIKSETYN
jgi:TonB family protein